jgi:hypothetical protein
MPKITPETHPHFRQLANEAIARKKAAKAQALALAESLLKCDPNAQAVTARLESQAEMIALLVAEEMGASPRADGARKSPKRLTELLKAQGVILNQLRLARGMSGQDKPQEKQRRRLLEPIRKLAERNPAETLGALQRVNGALPAPIPAHVLKAEQVRVEAESGPVDPASLLE